MTAHIPTLLLTIFIVGIVLTISVGAIVNRSQRDGMMYWAVGLAMHTASYLFFRQLDATGEMIAFVGANVLRACAWAAFAEGLYQFYRRPPPRTLIWTPVAIVFVIFVFLLEHLALRVVLVSLTFAAQSLLALSLMWRQRRETPGHGKYFLMAGLVMAFTLLSLRALGAMNGAAAEMVSLTVSSPVQTISFLGALIVLLLLSIGFMLMSKDRADHMNHVLAIQDELTGLANRRRLNEVLDTEWARSKRSQRSLTVLMIDIDHFKLYNDHYGHQAGDVCLQRVAQAIQSSAGRAGDLAARYGGEEFMLILPDTDTSAGRYLAEGVRKSVASLDLPHALSPTRKISISIGVATSANGVQGDAKGLVHAADQALYRAKHAGRNQVQVALVQHDTPTGGAAVNRIQLIWHTAYESGNPVIDAQHRAIFSDANQLLNASLDGRDKDEVVQLVDAFIAGIAQHFADEEALITQAGYPDVGDHAGLHQALIDKSVILAQRFRKDNLALGELFEYLAYEVVARHILSEDIHFFTALESSL